MKLKEYIKNILYNNLLLKKLVGIFKFLFKKKKKLNINQNQSLTNAIKGEEKTF